MMWSSATQIKTADDARGRRPVVPLLTHLPDDVLQYRYIEGLLYEVVWERGELKLEFLNLRARGDSPN